MCRYGGVYLDTDVIVMKNLASLRNCLGTEELGDAGQVKVLNGAVLVFDRGSSFIWECMREFNNTYKIESWGWNGPELVTRVARRFPQGADLHILPVAAFYPIHWRQVHKYFEVAHFDDSQHSAWQVIKESTYILHYWNKVTKDMVPKRGSLMYKVLLSDAFLLLFFFFSLSLSLSFSSARRERLVFRWFIHSFIHSSFFFFVRTQVLNNYCILCEG